jgi:hypothetical protein
MPFRWYNFWKSSPIFDIHYTHISSVGYPAARACTPFCSINTYKMKMSWNTEVVEIQQSCLPVHWLRLINIYYWSHDSFLLAWFAVTSTQTPVLPHTYLASCEVKLYCSYVLNVIPCWALLRGVKNYWSKQITRKLLHSLFLFSSAFPLSFLARN